MVPGSTPPWEVPPAALALPAAQHGEVSIAMGVPQKRWLIRESHIKMDDDEGTPILGTPS